MHRTKPTAQSNTLTMAVIYSYLDFVTAKLKKKYTVQKQQRSLSLHACNNAKYIIHVQNAEWDILLVYMVNEQKEWLPNPK